MTCVFTYTWNQTSSHEGASGNSYRSNLITSPPPPLPHSTYMAHHSIYGTEAGHSQGCVKSSVVPIRDGTVISTWSSELHEGLAICRCYSRGSILDLSYFKTLSI